MMHLKHFYDQGLAHSSYLIGGQEESIVVDPSRDIQKYLDEAKSANLPITGIIETHLHADFISGHMDLAKATDASIYASQTANCEFEHIPVQEDKPIQHDTLKISLVNTPGHTPESAVFLIADLERTDKPILAFTGDTLLVGDVGRPDLFPEKKEELAGKLYESLSKLSKLADYIEVYPAHGMGSLCGRALSAKLWTTLGIEKQWNEAFSLHPKDVFIKDLLAVMPEAPDHFSRCSEINRLGPTKLKDLPIPEPLGPDQFQKKMESEALVVDVRSFIEYAGAHIPQAYAVPLQGKFSTYAGWVLPFDHPILLVVENQKQLDEALRGLRAVGHDNVTGYLDGGINRWINSGKKTNHIETISIQEFHEIKDDPDYTLLDNRLKSEWDEGHIEGTIHAPTPDIRERYQEWDPDKPVVTFCNTSNRSILAASLLKQRGFKRVLNMVGGTTAWTAAGHPFA